MKRKSPLDRSTPLKQRTRLRPVSDRRRKRDRNYNVSRAAVYERGGGRCEHVDQVTGVRCPGFIEQVHHIAGRLGPDPHRMDNLVGLCAWHHDLVHANPGWARSVGLMRSRLGGDAA